PPPPVRLPTLALHDALPISVWAARSISAAARARFSSRDNPDTICTAATRIDLSSGMSFIPLNKFKEINSETVHSPNYIQLEWRGNCPLSLKGSTLSNQSIGNHMTLATYAAQRRKLEKGIQRLQKQAGALEKKQRAPVINTIVRSMREHDITPEEIANAFSRKSRSASKPANANSGAARAPVPPKFRNPE